MSITIYGKYKYIIGIPRLITLRNSLPITSQSIDREIIVAMNYSEVILKQGD
jgi:hypothetical protein